MKRSIRFGLVDWLDRVCDQVAEKLVNLLCGPETHSKTSGHLCEGLVPGVPNCAPEGYGNHPHVLTSLHQQINECYRPAVIADFHEFVPAGQPIPAGNLHFVNHHALQGNHPDLAKMNAAGSGVERAS